MAELTGVLIHSGGQERIPYATVKATQQGQPGIYATAGENGEFSLQLSESGKWSLVALEPAIMVAF
jgi:hypothetical protein